MVAALTGATAPLPTTPVSTTSQSGVLNQFNHEQQNCVNHQLQQSGNLKRRNSDSFKQQHHHLAKVPRSWHPHTLLFFLTVIFVKLYIFLFYWPGALLYLVHFRTVQISARLYTYIVQLNFCTIQISTSTFLDLYDIIYFVQKILVLYKAENSSVLNRSVKY